MVTSYPATRQTVLKGLFTTALAAGFIAYCFMVISLVRYGDIRIPLMPNRPSTKVVATNSPVRGDDKTPWTYDFRQLANGALPDADWNFEVGNKVAEINSEAQTYTARPENVRIENGSLVLEARRESLNGKQFTSARVNTKGSFDFTYGTLEIDAMLPAGVGTWPAAWLLPTEPRYKPELYGVQHSDRLRWAVNGEIDVMEAIGSRPNQNLPHLHSYNELSAPPFLTPGYIENPYSEYHRYGIIKTATKNTFTIDGTPFYSQEKTSDSPLDWPYDQPYYLIINFAIGGNWEKFNVEAEEWPPRQLKIRTISYRPL